MSGGIRPVSGSGRDGHAACMRLATLFSAYAEHRTSLADSFKCEINVQCQAVVAEDTAVVSPG